MHICKLSGIYPRSHAWMHFIWASLGKALFWKAFHQDTIKVIIDIRPLAPLQNSVSVKLMQGKTLNFMINLPDVENLTK